MAVANRHGLPEAVCIESATPHEVKLAVPTLVQMVTPEASENLIGDNAYDSDKLDLSCGWWSPTHELDNKLWRLRLPHHYCLW